MNRTTTRTKAGIVLFFCAMALVACKKKRPPPNTGVPECDEYIVAYEACIDKMGAMARSAAESALKAQRDGFEKAAATPEAKKALGPQCKQLKESIKASCP
jgi:hypothetical protein